MDTWSSRSVAERPDVISARVLLVFLAIVLAALLVLSGVPATSDSSAAFAQSTGTAPTIELLNPDSTTSTEISAKNDGEGATYHLVAWVSNPPANAVVQFKYQPANSPELGITCVNTGSQNAGIARNDTYECEWNLQGTGDGSGAVRAELYNEGAGRVAQDEEDVTVNSAGQTVEIVYPRQTQAIGFYTGPDGIASGVVDVKTSAAGTPGGDEGTQRVTVYYSMSPPGAEPVFDDCGTETTTGGTQDSIRCDLPADDQNTPQRENDPSRITAIAAAAGDTTEGSAPDPGCSDPRLPVCDRPDVDAADAHRAFGYEQDPGSVSVTPQTQQVPAGTCSQVIKAQVLDTNGRHVVGVNVDVHAAGPSDNLFFDDDDTPTNNTSRSKAADNHASETAADCEDGDQPIGFDGAQGDHDSADDDIKHIESLNGTDENGDFRFQLYTFDGGTTQFSVWADEDGDDRRCTAEPTGIGSIGWSEAPPSPTGTEAEPCPTPTATGTPTQSPSASPTATQTSPSGTNTTTSGPTSDRTVALSADRGRTLAGQPITFSGRIFSNDSSCSDAQEFVQIRRRIHGTNRYRNLAGVNTDDQGTFTLRSRQRKSADYLAVAPAHDQCKEATSSPVSVLVRVRMQIAASDATPNRGQLIRIKSSVRPQHDGTRLVLQRKKGDRWIRFMVRKLNRRSVADYVFRASFKQARFRTRWNSQSAANESGTSRIVTIRTH